MLVGTTLNSIGFLSSSDSTRLQMSAKQLNQTISSINCERPYVIGNDYKYLSQSSKLFKKVARYDGEVLYSNDDILVVALIDNNDIAKIETYDVTKYKSTANSFCTQIRNRIYSGPFSKGDVLFEYDCFNEDVPCYGYNANTMYFPWFGYNFEDSVVISESLANKAVAIKNKKLNIYVYKHSVFKFIYDDSKYGFIPEIGQKINKNIVLSQINNKTALIDVEAINVNGYMDKDISYTAHSITCKLENAKVQNIKIHRVDQKRCNLMDKALDDRISKIRDDYALKVKDYSIDLQNNVGPIAANILRANYVMRDIKLLDVRREDLMYVIELELVKEYPSDIGDKFANRFGQQS